MSYLVHVLFPRPFSIESLATLTRNSYHDGQEFFGLWNYRNPLVRTVIRYLKNHNDAELSGVLATYLVEQLSKHSFPEPIFIIPTPASKKSYTQRGFNQVLHISRSIAQQLGAVCDTTGYIQKRETKKQSLLPRSERMENIRDAFYCRHHISFREYPTVIIIDDVITTGATMRELRRFVQAHGGTRVIGVSIAR